MRQTPRLRIAPGATVRFLTPPQTETFRNHAQSTPFKPISHRADQPCPVDHPLCNAEKIAEDHAVTKPQLSQEERDLRLIIWVLYTSPFQRPINWLWKIDKADVDTADEDLPTVGPARDWLACQLDKLDTRWREYYAKRNKYPPKRWRTVK